MNDRISFTDFERDCLHWRSRILTAPHAHWCNEWDGRPVDETCPEWPCGCYAEEA